MALIDCESFNGYSSTTMASKFTGPLNGVFNTHMFIDGAGMVRTGTTGLRMAGGSGAYCGRVIPQNLTTAVVGMAFATTAIPVSGSYPIFGLQDNATSQVEVRLDASGRFFITRNGTTIVNATGSTTLVANLFYYLELLVTISDTVGVATLRVNGVQEITGSTLNTKTTANFYFNTILWACTGAPNLYYNDLYVTNGNFFGPVKIYAVFPSAAGTNSAMTPSVAPNYACVKENPPNTTDYVSTSVAGLTDTYQHTTFTPNGTILGVKQNMYCQDVDLVRSIAGAVKCNGGVTLSIGTPSVANSAYTYKERIIEVEPGSGLAWTATSFNAAEFGQQSA